MKNLTIIAILTGCNMVMLEATTFTMGSEPQGFTPIAIMLLIDFILAMRLHRGIKE